MKLAAIYNVWSDWDWLRLSVENIKRSVDGVIIVHSKSSNYGEIDEGFQYQFDIGISGTSNFIFYPSNGGANKNETNKRNYGLDIARKAGYTHFITMDADEMYHVEDILKAKELFQDPELNGLVCRIKTYFKSPTLTIGFDTTLVPFIHKITPELKHDFNRKYPFAWEGNSIRIDPTRSLNIDSGVKMCDVVMHHYSWVRKDYEKKIRNSTARANLERSTIREDLRLAKDGQFIKFYGKSLLRVEAEFEIPEMNVSDI